jgi:uncharacterized protein YuzE
MEHDVYAYVKDPSTTVNRQKQVADGVILDLDEAGQVIGVEVLGALQTAIDGTWIRLDTGSTTPTQTELDRLRKELGVTQLGDVPREH